MNPLYSQGAHVVLDVLGGGGGVGLGASAPPISSSVASHVTASTPPGN